MDGQLRVLHAADLHIDSPLHGLVDYEGAPVEELRAATRRAMDNLVAEAIERQVHLVLVAGDLYDGDWRDYNTGLFVVARLAELNEAGIPVVILYGNHDAASHLTKHLRLPPNTTALDSQAPQTVTFDELGLAVHGQSYANRAVTADLAAGYPPAERSLINIGVLHTCFDGAAGHERYAPCTMDVLRAKGYDYWALGHVHQGREVATDPLTVFPGNLQGRHAKETGPKGATIVTFTDGVPGHMPLVLDVVRWEHLTVDVTGAASPDDCLDRCADALAHMVDDAVDTYATRVTLTGETSASRALRGDQERLRGEIRALGLTQGGPEVWIEKVVTATTEPLRRGAAGSGPLAEIAAVLDELRTDPASVLQLDVPAARVLRELHKDLRAAAGPDATPGDGADTRGETDGETVGGGAGGSAGGVLGPGDLDRLLVDAAELLISRLDATRGDDAD